MCGNDAATESNFLLWRVDGLSHAYSERKGFLPDNKPVWHTWRVVFDRDAGTLALYTGEGGTTPVLVQKGVDLDGVTVHSLWLNGAGTNAPEADCYLDYDDLTVTYTPVEGSK